MLADEGLNTGTERWKRWAFKRSVAFLTAVEAAAAPPAAAAAAASSGRACGLESARYDGSIAEGSVRGVSFDRWAAAGSDGIWRLKMAGARHRKTNAARN